MVISTNELNLNEFKQTNVTNVIILQLNFCNKINWSKQVIIGIINNRTFWAASLQSSQSSLFLASRAATTNLATFFNFL